MLAALYPHGRKRAATLAGALSLLLLLSVTLAACGSSTTPGASQRAGVNAPGMTLVVMGASDAFGIGTYDAENENWPAQLASVLPQPTHLVNLGVPGATLAQAQQEELPIAVSQRAQVVVIWLAVNDIINDTPLALYSSELRATLATLRTESPGTHVFVGNVPDLTHLPYFAGDGPTALHAEIVAWNAVIGCIPQSRARKRWLTTSTS
jgi:acyl-CoA thioesterase I